MISASAIASADSLSALLPLAVEAVRVAFRLGAHVAGIAERLEEKRDYQDSWSTILAVADRASAETALQRFHDENGIANSNRMWISAVSVSSITVSGPPSIRKRLFATSDYFKSSHQAKVPVHGPFHAAHLHARSDIKNILSPELRKAYASASLKFPVHSSVTGKEIEASSPLDLLEKCLEEILLKPLRWDNVLEECIAGDLAPIDAKCSVHAIGPTNLASSMVSALKMAGDVEVSVDDHTAWSSRPTTIPGIGKKVDSKIAIVGMAGRFPDAADHEKFWELLVKGLDVHREVPADRYPVDTHTDPSSKKKNTSHTPYGCFIEKPGLFDARFFNMSPREAAQTDPMQRLELATAYEAMEMAGIVPERTPSTKKDRIGTFYGQTSDDWREINAAQDIDTYFISGGVRAFGAGRVNYHFKFSGPSFTVDTACSSSLAAIQLACTSLRAGECDTAFTGGANVLTNPDIFSGLSRGHFLSKTGSCKTFDNDADGYCRGDGVATVILKRLEDAVADKDPILGVIRGAATNHSAEAVSITHPHVGAQQFLFSKVLQENGVDAHDISYVEMHGTGTQAGDGIEMESVSTTFAPTNRRRRADQPVYLGAVKSNIGHGEAVSGVCSLVKILLMLRNNAIPPHAGIKGEINKTFPKDLKERNINIAMKKTDFPRPEGGKRTVFLNNFSAAGGNTALLLEDGPLPAPIENPDPRSTHVVTVSAKSLASFRNTASRLLSFIEHSTVLDLASLAYSTTARRSHYNYRAAFPVASIDAVKSSLKAVKDESPSPISAAAPPTAFVFTGQGSQYPALGKHFFETSRQFRSEIDQFNQIAEGQGFPSFLGLVDGSVQDIKTLSPVAVQLGMTCVQIALVRLWATWGIQPTAVVGHSLGEYAALNAAGVLSISDTIYLVGKRASLLESKCTIGTHAMLAVKGSVESIRSNLNGKTIEIACINGPMETVLSGTVAEIDAVAEELNGQSFRTTKLNVPFAFHSSQVDPILETFVALGNGATYHTPSVPVISPLLGRVIREDDVFGPTYLAEHCRKTVDFLGGLNAAVLDGTVDKKTVWVEIGAHPVCSNMVKSTVASTTLTVPSLRKEEDAWKTIANSLCGLYSAGVAVDWSAYHQDFEGSVQLLQIPTYGYDEKNYWLDYTNDWTLTKGNPAGSIIPIEDEKPKLQTTTIHKIIKEDIKDNTGTVIAETDLADPKLHTAVSGHLVNGSGLCPSSIYADMALTIANYAYKQVRPEAEDLSMNVAGMECPAPLILKNVKKPEKQVIEIETNVDVMSRKATVTISTPGKSKTVHGHCTVIFENSQNWVTEWERRAFLVQTRIDMLKMKMDAGDAHKLQRGMAYKLFAALVQYSDKFRGMKEVVLDSANLEASSNVQFQAGPLDGDFFCSPYFIDSVAHLAGFIMNANDEVDSKTQVYISHGWESMKFAKPLEHDGKYYSYVKMMPHGGPGSKMVAGDVFVFDENNDIIGVVGGLKFQCIPRQLLNTFLPPVGAAGVSSAPAKPQAAAKSAAKPATKPAAKPAEKKAAPKPKKATPKKKAAAANGGITTKALNIVATEIGVESSELADAIEFPDLGVDSLMSLTISGRLREELGLEVQSDLFTEFPTIGDLKGYLAKNDTEVSAEPVDEEEDEGNDDESTDSDDTSIATPELVESRTTGKQTTEDSEAQSPMAEDTGDEVITVIRSTIADEMGVDTEEIADNTDLSTMGMDSLMSLTILGILREKTDMSFEPSLLSDNPSLGEVRGALGLEKKEKPVQTKVQQELPQVSEKLNKVANRPPPATSILLQGNPKTATKKLFLFPDGSGSATSYVSIPPLDNKDICVYGLNCPYMKDPASYTCGIEGVSKIYLEEVQRRQPEGPYTLGGWSAGGVVAFEVARQFYELGKTNPGMNCAVEKLIMIDSPCPIALEPLPGRLHEFFDEIGLLGTGQKGGTPAWLLPHFDSSIKALQAYVPKGDNGANIGKPKAFMIWATDGVCKNPEDPRPPPQEDDPKSMKWLLNNRTDFGYNGWDKLLGGENMTMDKISGNHFTMMREPIVSPTILSLIETFL